MASDTGGVIHHLSGPMTRVAAALTQPEPEDPTGNQAITRALIAVSGGLCYFTADAKHAQLLTVQKILLEALRPEPEGVTARELQWPSSVAQGCHEAAAEAEPGSPMQQLLVAAGDLLENYARPAIKPVPVTERLPGPEDYDAENRCWWFCPAAILPSGQCAYWCLAPADGSRSWFTHWLPHQALPIPTTH